MICVVPLASILESWGSQSTCVSEGYSRWSVWTKSASVYKDLSPHNKTTFIVNNIVRIISGCCFDGLKFMTSKPR